MAYIFYSVEDIHDVQNMEFDDNQSCSTATAIYIFITHYFLYLVPYHPKKPILAQDDRRGLIWIKECCWTNIENDIS